MVNESGNLKNFIVDYMKKIEEKEVKKKIANDRYNQEHYTKLTYRLDKDLVRSFKEECCRMNISQASVIKAFIENFIEK